jgi:hypothetical protein
VATEDGLWSMLGFGRQAGVRAGKRAWGIARSASHGRLSGKKSGDGQTKREGIDRDPRSLRMMEGKNEARNKIQIDDEGMRKREGMVESGTGCVATEYRRGPGRSGHAQGGEGLFIESDSDCPERMTRMPSIPISWLVAPTRASRDKASPVDWMCLGGCRLMKIRRGCPNEGIRRREAVATAERSFPFLPGRLSVGVAWGRSALAKPSRCM